MVASPMLVASATRTANRAGRVAATCPGHSISGLETNEIVWRASSLGGSPWGGRCLSDAQREQLSGFPTETRRRGPGPFLHLQRSRPDGDPPPARRREPPGLGVTAVRSSACPLNRGQPHSA